MSKKTFHDIMQRIFKVRAEIEDFSNWHCYLPAKLYAKISPEAHDAMESILHEKFLRVREFASAYKNRLFELGEKVGK